MVFSKAKGMREKGRACQSHGHHTQAGWGHSRPSLIRDGEGKAAGHEDLCSIKGA